MSDSTPASAPQSKRIVFQKPNLSLSFVKGLAEIAVIVVWAFWVGRAYLNFSPSAIPGGGEFWMGLQSHYSWQLLKECGSCFFWNGFTNGGTPAFVEVHGAWLHPFVAVLTLLFDVLKGAKLAVILSLITAGIAQWWLCKVLETGSISRVWSSMLVVAAGHLAGKMEMGLVPLVTSVASCSLVIPPAISLALHGRRRTAILLGCTLALAILSGQGYVQIGLLVAILPAVLILLFNRELQLKSQWKYFLLAGLLALLLAGIFVVPLSHFSSSMGKDLDPYFSSVQPFKYLMLNLLVDDGDFYYSPLLTKQPFPYLYVNYIGWIPLILAMCALPTLFSKRRQLASFFVVAIPLIFLAGSGLTFKILGTVMTESVIGIRNPSVIASLAVPLLLGLAALGVDALFQNQNTWLAFSTIVEEKQRYALKFNLSWFAFLPLALALVSVSTFSARWMRVDNNDYANLTSVISTLQTPTTQWVQTPVGEHFWLPKAMDANLKIANYFRPWHWKGREKPKPYLAGFRQQPLPEEGEVLGTFDGIFVTQSLQNEYAIVQTPGGNIPCTAHARGGNIDVDCTTEQAGTLLVQENSWSGWSVKVDGASSSLMANTWLATQAPAGRHHFEFRYRPWDVALGIIVTLLGLIAAIWLWWKSPNTGQETAKSDQSRYN